jgi:peroxiredoxin
MKEKAFDFKKLKNANGDPRGLSDYKDKLVVVLFSCNHCPYVKAYESRYKIIQADYQAKGVRLVAINSNDAVNYPDDSFENMVRRAKDKGYNFDYLHDEDQRTARAFGASNTPHVFVLDEARHIRYSGRIDDNWENAKAVRTHDLRDALDALLKGNEPTVSSTLPVGCSIKWKK